METQSSSPANSRCITTYTGLHIDPSAPTADALRIEDIAHALSLLCRGNGHVRFFYSVGQHCIACAREAIARGYSQRVILACLLHDASEAYLSDVPRPFKKSLVGYKEAEDLLLNLLYERFLGTPLTPEETAQIKDIDDAMLYYDLKILLLDPMDREPPNLFAPLSRQFEPFDAVEQEFLSLYEQYRIL